jgi:hypothetical protein
MGLLRDLDRGFVPVRVEPFRRRHLPKPVEAVQPIACHGVKPSNCCAAEAAFATETSYWTEGFMAGLAASETVVDPSAHHEKTRLDRSSRAI